MPGASRDGQPVESREAVRRRDRLIEKLASLPPVPGALDQIVVTTYEERLARQLATAAPDLVAVAHVRATPLDP